jgi:uncharacterized protein (TIGR02246 family)
MRLFVGVHALVLLVGMSAVAGAQDTAKAAEKAAPATQDGERETIKKEIQSYVKAFNDRAAKDLAAHWSPEGVYVSRLSGDQIVGREALEAEFAALFAEEKGTRLEVATDSVEFISPNVALERGSASVIRADEPPSRTTYRVVYVKQGGKWLIDRVTEEAVPEIQSHYEHLKGLEWMVGKWSDQEGQSSVKTECEWTRNKNFLTRSFAASIDGEVDMAGMQVVGWDPAAKVIRSWVFDSDGGFAEGVWKNSGKHWVVRSTATLPGGKKGSSTSIFRPIDDKSFGWQRISRVVDGNILPNIDEMIIVRSESQP